MKSQVVNRLNEDIYNVYTDYVSDWRGDYKAIIGYKVNDFTDLPDGFIAKEIPADNYKRYVSKGSMPEAVVNTWKEIWQDEDLPRSYRADFTVLGEKYYDGDSAEAETYISIK